MLRIIKELFVNWRTTDISIFNQHSFKGRKLLPGITIKLTFVSYSQSNFPQCFSTLSALRIFSGLFGMEKSHKLLHRGLLETGDKLEADQFLQNNYCLALVSLSLIFQFSFYLFSQVEISCWVRPTCSHSNVFPQLSALQIKVPFYYSFYFMYFMNMCFMDKGIWGDILYC